MPDVWSQQKRSEVMALIRSKGNKSTELAMVSIFRAYGIKGWRRNCELPGKPDFVFPRQRLALFVDGCFWHGCRLHCRLPKSRADFWAPKIQRNKSRDKKVVVLLREKNWRVIRVWEHAFKNPELIASKLKRFLALDPPKL